MSIKLVERFLQNKQGYEFKPAKKFKAKVEFRDEFIKFNVDQIKKMKELETKAEKEKALMKSILKEFSNQSVDDPYNNKKSKSQLRPNQQPQLIKKSRPKVLQAVKPIQGGKTPFFGTAEAEMRKTKGKGTFNLSTTRQPNQQMVLNLT
jgi:hypothetical protein